MYIFHLRQNNKCLQKESQLNKFIFIVLSKEKMLTSIIMIIVKLFLFSFSFRFKCNSFGRCDNKLMRNICERNIVRDKDWCHQRFSKQPAT
jgi:hypothetical protein